MAETAEPMGVKARRALYERARQPSAEKLPEPRAAPISGTEAGGVRSAARAYQTRLTAKEQAQNVLRGKRDAPVAAAAAPNYVVAGRGRRGQVVALLVLRRGRRARACRPRRARPAGELQRRAAARARSPCRA